MSCSRYNLLAGTSVLLGSILRYPRLSMVQGCSRYGGSSSAAALGSNTSFLNCGSIRFTSPATGTRGSCSGASAPKQKGTPRNRSTTARAPALRLEVVAERRHNWRPRIGRSVMTYPVQAMAAARRNLIQRTDSFLRATVRGERRPTAWQIAQAQKAIEQLGRRQYAEGERTMSQAERPDLYEPKSCVPVAGPVDVQALLLRLEKDVSG